MLLIYYSHLGQLSEKKKKVSSLTDAGGTGPERNDQVQKAEIFYFINLKMTFKSTVDKIVKCYAYLDAIGQTQTCN